MTKPTCVAIGLFALVGALAPLGCSGNDAGDPSPDVGSSLEQSPLTVGSCISDSMGGPTSCKSAETWKQYASDSCESGGLALDSYTLGAPCNGSGGFVGTKFTCCKAAPPPPPPPPTSNTTVLGDATSCKSAPVWKAEAFAHCSEAAQTVSSFVLGPICGASDASSVKVTCCGAGPLPPVFPPPPPGGPPVFPPKPPPPPASCDWRQMGGPTSCKDAATWKTYANDACNADGLVLGQLSIPTVLCDSAGGTSEVKFTCCK